MITKRESGLDLVRLTASLFVVSVHSFLYNGFPHFPQTGAAMLFFGAERYLFIACNGLFLVLSGCLKSAKPAGKQYYLSLLPFLTEYFISGSLAIAARVLLLRETESPSVWLRRLFSFSAVPYAWFFEMYFCLILLSPVINLAVQKIESNSFLLLLCGAWLFVTAVPGAFKPAALPDHFRVMWPMTYYLLGAVIRRLQPKISSAVCMLSAVLVSLMLGFGTFFSTNGRLETALQWEFGDLGVVIIVLSVFLALFRLRITGRTAAAIAFFSRGAMGVCIFSYILDTFAYTLVPAWNTPEKFWLAHIFITVPVWFISLCLGTAMNTLAHRICKKARSAAAVPASAPV